MEESKRYKSIWLLVAGIYALLVAVPTILELLSTLTFAPGIRVIAAIIAVAFTASAIALIQKKEWGRMVFLVAAPFASIGIAGVFPSIFWKEDIPYTAVAIFAYIPLTFFLSRASTLQSLGLSEYGWTNRGGGILVGCAVIMFLLRLITMSSKPNSGGLEALIVYVKFLAMCDVTLWNYVGGLIAVSIPTRAKNIAM